MNFDIHRTTQHAISALEFAEAMYQTEIIKILQETAQRQENKGKVKFHIDKPSLSFFTPESKDKDQPNNPKATTKPAP